MMEQLETGNIGIGNTSTLATLNNDRFIIVDQKEIFWTGASLRMLGDSPSPLRRWARRASLGFSNQSARRHPNVENTVRGRSRRVDLAERRGCDILCAW